MLDRIKMGENQDSWGPCVEVGVCTFRRESLSRTLESLAHQLLPAGVRLRVIVVDNDDTATSKGPIKATANRLGLDCRYVHAPFRNISVARNACLDHASEPLLAFIDDDEVADVHWMANLLRALESHQADAVLGPAQAVYPPDAPYWTARADLHSTRPPRRRANALRTGYTCNVLLKRESFAGCRFDPGLGRTGGEDDVFFAAAARGGAKICYAPEAVVFDPVPSARLNLRWLCKRSFRNGQTYARTICEARRTRVPAGAVSIAKACLYGFGALVYAARPAAWRKMVVKGVLHLGATAYFLGLPEIEIY